MLKIIFSIIRKIAYLSLLTFHKCYFFIDLCSSKKAQISNTKMSFFFDPTYTSKTAHSKVQSLRRPVNSIEIKSNCTWSFYYPSNHFQKSKKLKYFLFSSFYTWCTYLSTQLFFYNLNITRIFPNDKLTKKTWCKKFSPPQSFNLNHICQCRYSNFPTLVSNLTSNHNLLRRKLRNLSGIKYSKVSNHSAWWNSVINYSRNFWKIRFSFNCLSFPRAEKIHQ